MVVSIEELVRKVNDLPALPGVAAQVLRLTDNPETSMSDLGRIIATDQNLTARVLRLANSAALGASRRIATVSDATVLLGIKRVRNLVLTASVNGFLKGEVKGYALAQGELWRHSLAVAVGSMILARRARFPGLEEAFVAGLLHDIGKVVLNEFVGAAFYRIVGRSRNGEPFMTAEQEVLGYNHAEVGSLLAEKWSLPPILVEPIRLHHRPGEAVLTPKLVAIVHLADALSMMLGMGVGSDGLLYPIEGDAAKSVGLGEHDLEECFAELSDALKQEKGILDSDI